MGSAIAFSNKKASVLLNNLIKNQHNSISFAILTQSVTKNIRAKYNLANLLKKLYNKICVYKFRMYQQKNNLKSYIIIV